MPRMILSPAGSSPLTRGKRRRRSRRLQAARLIPAHAGKTRGAGRVAPRPSAHPRSRGENNPNLLKEAPPVGSSPLTRGKRDRALEVLGPWRLIPAHAGKTRIRRPTSSLRSAHPRSRGENTAFFRWAHGAGGSSPLTRGKRRITHVVRVIGGLIPAHAGKTIRLTRRIRLPRAHPRSRGENRQLCMTILRGIGSSPLTRGKPTVPLDFNVVGGLIPAHAGKTLMRGSDTRNGQAHPRSRGENLATFALGLGVGGSSPLTRGKPRPGRIPGPPPRLIPAHAGKTTWTGAYSPPTKAHPRSRGENRCGHRRGCGRRGSSPLTRGKHRRPARDRRGLGLIPAHAGKTTPTPRSSSLLRAHPRSRGENAAGIEATIRDEGSSPLTRGKLRRLCGLKSSTGLIPAHAGKTLRIVG